MPLCQISLYNSSVFIRFLALWLRYRVKYTAQSLLAKAQLKLQAHSFFSALCMAQRLYMAYGSFSSMDKISSRSPL